MRGSSSVALEVGSCLHHMVAAVEQQEQAEERQVVQVCMPELWVGWVGGWFGSLMQCADQDAFTSPA